MNQKKRRILNRQEKLQRYSNSVEQIIYDHNKSIYQNIQKIAERAQEYLEILREMTFEYEQPRETIHNVFDTFQSPTTSVTTIAKLRIDDTDNSNITLLERLPIKENFRYTSEYREKTTGTKLQNRPQSILSEYVSEVGNTKGIVHNKQILETKQTKGHMNATTLCKFFEEPPVVITDKETILALKEIKEPGIKPQLCKTDKHTFEELRTSMSGDHTTIIQVIDSTLNKRNKEVLFCLIGKDLLYNTTEHSIKHIYFNWNRFWDNDLNEWNKEGDFLSRWTKNKEEPALKKSVNFTPQTYKNKIFVQIEAFSDIDIELPKLIEKFENKEFQGQQEKIPRVLIGVLGTKSKTRSMLTKFLQKVDNPELLENRIIWYKNLKQYQTKLEELSVTHIVDTRHGYLRQVVYDDKILRKCFLIRNPKDLKHEENFKYIDKIEEMLLTDTIDNSTDNKQTNKPRNKYPEMIEKFMNNKEGRDYPHDQGGIKKFITWNMNSIRSVNTKNFLSEFLLTCNADIIGVTEVKGTIRDTMRIKNMRQILLKAGYYFTYFNVSKNHTGQHGTAIFSRIAAREVIKDCGGCSYTEGRLLTTIFENFIFVLTYTPTLSKPPGEPIQNKERREMYDLQLKKHMQTLKEKYKKPIILSGDLNCAIYKSHATHEYLFNGDQPSCTLEEQERIKNIMSDHNLTVAHDEIHKDNDLYVEKLEDNSTFYMSDKSNEGTRIGLKIDHFLTPKEWFDEVAEDQPKVLNCRILRDQQGSDHLPVSMTVRFPKSYSFPIPQRQTKKKQTATEAYINTFMNTPHKSKISRTDPLAYRGIHGRSSEINTLKGDEKEQEEIMLSLIETKQRMDNLTDKQLLEDPEFSNNYEKTTEMNEIREEQRETTDRPVWIPHIAAKFSYHSNDWYDTREHRKEIEKICMVDTGANQNIIGLPHLHEVADKNIHLEETDIFFKVGDTSKVQVLGKVKLNVDIEGRKSEEEFFVMENTNFDVLFGCSFTHKYSSSYSTLGSLSLISCTS